MKPLRVSVAASVALGVAVLAPGYTPALAAATPGAGVEGVVMSQATLNGKDYISREITIAPGGTTGWHYHPGQLFGVIKEGTLTHYEGDCSVDGVYNPGDAITERSGTGYVHEGRNEGSTPLVMWVLYIDPAGSPLAVDMPNPGCPFE